MNDSPILIVDSDIDDQELLEQAWAELQYSNKLYFFKTAEEALLHIQTEPIVPFLIISEFLLPTMSGLDFKQHLLDHKLTNYKSIPFVFLSANITQSQIEKAYDLRTNGIFKKHDSFDKIKQQLIDIAKYWRECLVPLN